MRRVRVRAGSLLLASTLLLNAAPALGAPKAPDPDAQVEQLARQAQDEYKKGDYKKSAETLLKAYDIKPVSKLLFNVGRTYEKAEDTDKAIRYYQRYLDTPGGEPELIQKAARSLDALRALKLAEEYEEKARRAEEQRKTEEAQRQAEEERKRLEAERQQLAEQQGRTFVVVRQQNQPEEKQGPSLALPIAFLSVSGLALAGGVYFGLDASTHKEQWSRALELDQKRQFAADAKSSALLADVSFGVSALSAVAGGYFLWSSMRDPAVAPNPVAILPTAGGAPGLTVAAVWGL